jgi:hypothetical protein
MKVGDIYYFVHICSPKITKHKISNIRKTLHSTPDSWAIIYFTGIKYTTFKHDFDINPRLDECQTHLSKFRNESKGYLIFTDAENAQKALNEFVFPKIIQDKVFQTENLLEQYKANMVKIAKMENVQRDNKDNFTKKCNALKNKSV